jgi:glycosyltransferase involved in cell wall biosynthesis
MKKLNKITIICAVKNDSKNLKNTLDSLLLETDKVNEVIIVDGGSSDEINKLIDKYSNDLNIIFISEPDKGIYDAMNKGWAKADLNNYIMFLGAGDKVIALPDLLDSYDADIIYGETLHEIYGLIKSKVNFKLMLGNTIHHQSMMVKKIINPTPPFSLKYPIYSDFDFNQRLYKKKYKFKKDKNFKSFALGGGASQLANMIEMVDVSRSNYGILIGFFSYVYLRIKEIKIRFKLRNFK